MKTEAEKVSWAVDTLTRRSPTNTAARQQLARGVILAIAAERGGNLPLVQIAERTMDIEDLRGRAKSIGKKVVYLESPQHNQ